MHAPPFEARRLRLSRWLSDSAGAPAHQRLAGSMANAAVGQRAPKVLGGDLRHLPASQRQQRLALGPRTHFGRRPGAGGGNDLGGSGLGVGDDRLGSAARGVYNVVCLALRLQACLADLILDGVEVGLDRFDARLQPLLLRFRRLAPLVELLE